jgi:translation initiation factor IF-3
VRLIDDQGTQVGIITIRDALQLAEERGLDLVEVAPTAVPPVCRLMDYGKFRYEQSKKEREARKNQKQAKTKQVRLEPKTDKHDIVVKAKQARRFLNEGDKVKFNVRFRGREIFHPEIGREMLEQIAEELQDLSTIEQKPLMEGRQLSLVLAPNAKALKEAARAARAAAQRAAQARAAQQAAAASPDSDATAVAEAPVVGDEDLDDEVLDENLDGEDLDDEDLDDEDLDDEDLDDEDLDDEDLDDEEDDEADDEADDNEGEGDDKGANGQKA